MQKLNLKLLQIDIPATKSTIFHDVDTGNIIGLVIQDFAQFLGIIDWADKIAVKGCQMMKNLQVHSFVSF